MLDSIRCATHRPKGKLLTFPYGEGGPPPQAVVEEGPYERERFEADTRFLRTALAH